MQARYYDRGGRPVSEERWQELGRQPGYSRIGYTDETGHGQQVTGVTFWSGIAGDGPDGRCASAPARASAPPTAAPPTSRYRDGPTSPRPAGHHAVTARIDQVAAFLAGHASQLPATGPPCPARP